MVSGNSIAISATLPETEDFNNDSDVTDSNVDNDGPRPKKICQKFMGNVINQEKPILQVKSNPNETKQQIFELTKTTITLEHESKMELLELKKQAAKEKFLAYRAKAEYYRQKKSQ